MAASDPSMPPSDPTSQPSPSPAGAPGDVGAGGPPQGGADVSVTLPLANLIALHAVVTQLAQGVDAILKQAQGQQAGAGAPPAGGPPQAAPSPDIAAGGPPGGSPSGSPEDEDVLNDIRSSSR